MDPEKTPDKKEIQRINRLQSKIFSELVSCFDPPLAEGVPQRLKEIVASACICPEETVLDVGSGTGILIPLIKEYHPSRIYACDLSHSMLKQLKGHYPEVEAVVSDVRDLALPDASVHVVFINATYPNIVDKKGAFANIIRMMTQAGRMVISHPMGKSFIDGLRKSTPFPLDDFPEKPEARTLLEPYGFRIEGFIDKPSLYILVAVKR